MIPADDRAAPRHRPTLPEDQFLAGELAAMVEAAGPRQEAIQRLIEALLHTLREGSTELPLQPEADLTRRLREVEATESERLAIQQLLADYHARRAGGLREIAGAPGSHKPLILTRHALQIHRHDRLENQLLDTLQDLLAAPASWPPSVVETSCDRLLAEPIPTGTGAPIELSPDQARAVRRALLTRVHLIAGGPGTGKTSIVVALLRLFAHLTPKGLGRRSVALAAPTGKAADRLQSAVVAALSSPGPDGTSPIDPTTLPRATTLQKLLQLRRDGAGVYRDRHRPLSHTLVVVDEASMIDLQLFVWLLDALPPNCHLVLLGDANQLPSVEPGAVFRDLVALADDHWCSQLTQSFRQAETSAGRAVRRLAESILTTTGPEVLAGVPARPPEELLLSGTEWVRAENRATFEDFLEFWWQKVARPPARRPLLERTYRRDTAGWLESDRRLLEELFDHFTTHRLLTPIHGSASDFGTVGLNLRFLRRSHPEATDPLAPGQPVLVTQNLPERNLFNGDLGLTLWCRTGLEPARPVVVFAADEGPRAWDLLEIRSALQPAWASTVHKSQGSEYDTVAVLLPPHLRSLDRSLLYTATTRARRSVLLVGAERSLLEAIRQPSSRSTGLQRRWETQSPQGQDQPPGTQRRLF